MIIRNPSNSMSICVFGLGFSLIAANAIYGQDTNHPSPLYGDSEFIVSEDKVRPVRVSRSNADITNSTLTQRYSIKNIPVPTANPQRPASFAAHSSLVRDVQSALANTGFYDGKLDGIYGSRTREAIIAYQQSAGILPNGEASYELLSNLKSAQAIALLQNRETVVAPVQAVRQDEIRQPQLLVFDTETVAKIQTGLREKFAEEKIDSDGLVGKQTKSAIRRFQERFKLKATGELNEETMEKMVSVGIISSI